MATSRKRVDVVIARWRVIPYRNHAPRRAGKFFECSKSILTDAQDVVTQIHHASFAIARDSNSPSVNARILAALAGRWPLRMVQQNGSFRIGLALR